MPPSLGFLTLLCLFSPVLGSVTSLSMTTEWLIDKLTYPQGLDILTPSCILAAWLILPLCPSRRLEKPTEPLTP